VASYDDLGLEGANSGVKMLCVNNYCGGVSATRLFTSEGVKILSAGANDAVGWETTASFSITIDDTPPSSTVHLPSGAVYNGTGWFVALSASPWLEISAQDSVSGVAVIESRTCRDGARADGGSGAVFLTVSGTSHVVPLDAAGLWRTEFRVTDNAGNVSEVGWFEVVVTGLPLPGIALEYLGAHHVTPDGRNYVTAFASESASPTIAELYAVNNFVTELHWTLGSAIEQIVSSSPFEAQITVPEGIHCLAFHGVEAGLEEVHSSVSLYADGTAPVFDPIVFQGPFFIRSGTGYVTSAKTGFSVTATDPVLPGGVSGSGVAGIDLESGGQYSRITGPVMLGGLPQGPAVIGLRVSDNVWNQRETGVTVWVDDVPPETLVEWTAETYIRQYDGRLFVTCPALNPAHLPLANLVTQDTDDGCGVSTLKYKLDGSSLGGDLVTATLFADRQTVTVYTEGPHALRYRAVDMLGNVEGVKTLAFDFDKSAPVSTVGAVGTSYRAPGGTLYLGAQGGSPAFVVTVTDGAGVGACETFYSFDGMPYLKIQPGYPVPLPGGEVMVHAFSTDCLGWTETPAGTKVCVDMDPPAIDIAPQSSSLSACSGSGCFVAPGVSAVAYAFDPPIPSGLPGSGVGSIQARVDGALAGSSSSGNLVIPIPRIEGSHTVKVTARDRVENPAEEVMTFTVDATAPVTSLSPTGAFLDTGVVRYADVNTVFMLDAADLSVQGNAGSGAGSVSYVVRTAAGTVVQSSAVIGGHASFSITMTGSYLISYRALDLVGNLEGEKTFAVTVVPAGQVPSVVLVISGPRADLGAGEAVAWPASLATGAVKAVRAAGAPGASTLRLEAVPGGATEVWYDLAPVTGQTAPLPVDLGSLAKGVYTLSFHGIRNGAAEITTTATILSDGELPVISFSIGDSATPASFTWDGGTPADTSDDVVFVKPTAAITVTAWDPAPGSGLASLAARIDSGGWADVTGPLKAPTEGAHVLSFSAVDRVGLTRTESHALRVDATAPSTVVMPSGAVVTNSRGTFAPGNLTYSIAALDGPPAAVASEAGERPALPAAASGIGRILCRVDTAPAESAFDPAVPVSFVVGGWHMVYHRAQDRVGNLGNVGQFRVFVDSIPPWGITLAAFGPTVTATGGVRYLAASSFLSLTATDSGSGLGRIDVRLDEGIFGTYSMPVGFPAEGPHVLGVKAFDLVGNASELVEYSLVTDLDPPESVLVVDSGPSRQETGVLRIASWTKLGIQSFDPAVTTGIPGSGIKNTLVSVGGAPEGIYAGPFTVSPVGGQCLVSFRSRDKVLNTEAARTVAVLVDSSPPAAPAVAFDASSGSVALTWSDGGEPDLAGWLVYRTINGDPVTRVLISGTSLLESASFYDPGAVSLTFAVLTYEVVGRDVVGNTGPAGTVDLVPADLAPRILILAKGAELADGAYISATPFTLAVQVRGASGAMTVLQRVGAQSVTLFGGDVSTVVANEGEYQVTVTATASGGPLSVVRSFTVDVTPPVLYLAANGTTIYGGEEFEPPIKIEYSGSDPHLSSVTGTLNGAPITSGISLIQKGDYILTVTARDLAGNETTVSRSFKVKEYLPFISGLTAEAGDGYVRLSWTTVPGTYPLKEVRIYKKEGAGTLVLTRTVSGDALVFDDVRVENGWEYSYAFIAEDVMGRSGPYSIVTGPVVPRTVGWPMFQKDMLHQAVDHDQVVSLPLGARWRIKLAGNPQGIGFSGYGIGLTVSDVLYAASVGGDVRAYDLSSGEPALKWSRSGCLDVLGSPVYHHDRLYVTHAGGLSVFDAATGNEEWGLPVDVVGAGQESSPIIYHGVLYAGQMFSEGYYLVAVDIETRQVAWKYGPLNLFIKCSTAALDGRIYIVDGGGILSDTCIRKGLVKA